MSLPVQRSALPTRYRRNMGQLLSHPSGTVYLDLAGLPENTTRPLVEMTIPTVSGPEVISGYDSIFHLPANAVANGQINASVFGVTATNLAKDSWATSLDGWSASGSLHSIVNGKYRVDRTGVSIGEGQRDITNRLDKTKHYLITAHMSASGADGSFVRLYGNTATIKQTETINAGQSKRVGLIVSPAEFGANTNFTLRMYTVANAVTETHQFFIQEISAEEYALGLTALMQRYSYRTEGTKSTVSDCRLQSVGKNLFDDQKFVEKAKKHSGTTFTTFDGEDIIQIMPSGLTFVPIRLIEGIFNKNQQYTISFLGRKISNDTSVRFRFNYTDGTSSDSQSITNQTAYTHRTGISELGKTISFISIASGTPGGIYAKEVQLELGNTATPYEPFKLAEQFISAGDDLRSVPNGTKDEVSDGKHIKRISEPLILQTSSITNFQTDFTNFDRVAIHYPTLTGWAVPDIQGWSNDTVTGKVLISGFTEKARVDSVENVNTFFTNSNGNIGLCLPKGLYADLAQAQSALAGTTLNYQLAEEIETELTPVVREERVLPNRRI